MYLIYLEWSLFSADGHFSWLYDINPMEVGGLAMLYDKNSNATDLQGLTAA